MNVCLFNVSDHGISGEVNVLPFLIASALLNTCALWDWVLGLTMISPPTDLQCIWWHKGACEIVKAKKGQARTRREIVP